MGITSEIIKGDECLKLLLKGVFHRISVVVKHVCSSMLECSTGRKLMVNFMKLLQCGTSTHCSKTLLMPPGG